MKIRKLDSLEVRMNDLMATVVADVDLDFYRDMRWVRQVDEAGWPGDLTLIARLGWVRRLSGALVLKQKADGPYREADCFDLVDYESRVNRIYIPDDGVDPDSGTALGVLTGRGYALARNLLARIESDLERSTVVALIGVGLHHEDKPGGTVQLHEIHEDGVTLFDSDLDSYREEAVMVLFADPKFVEEWVPIPPMRQYH